MQSKKLKATLFALAAALLYSINMPFSKLLLTEIDPMFMAAFLYLGAGLGIGLIYLLSSKEKPQKNPSKNDLPFTLGMIVLDILAPIFLMLGLQTAITLTFVISCLIMLLGTIVVVLDTFIVNHAHEHTHNVFVGNQLIKSYTHSHPHHHYHEDQPTTQHSHFQHRHFHHTNHQAP